MNWKMRIGTFCRLKPFTCILVLCLGIPAAVAKNADVPVLADSTEAQPVKAFKEAHPQLEEFTITEFRYHGNERTKPFVIQQEMHLDKGDTVKMDKLRSTFERSEKALMNTRLFSKVKLVPIWLKRGKARVIVGVEERWYTYPRPIFELADRNFNNWWFNRGGGIDRVSYGLELTQKNMRGRNERLKLITQLGYNERYGLFYHIPYLSRRSDLGLRFGARFSRSKKTPYAAEGQNLNFYDQDEKYVNKQFTSQVRLIHRSTIDISHSWEAEFHSNWVAQPITQRNRDYYRGERQTQRFIRLRYQYERDFRDRVDYPTDGYLLRLEALQWGMGLFEGPSTTAFNGNYQVFEELNDRFTMGAKLAGRYSLPGDQPFSIERGFGYGKMFVRGYEYYVINGQDYALNRNELRYRVFGTKVKLPGVIPDKFEHIPFTLRLKAFTDHGVVWNHYTPPDARNLANQYLVGYGLGLDITSYYDFIFRLEYAFNDRSESDLFFHFGLPF